MLPTSHKNPGYVREGGLGVDTIGDRGACAREHISGLFFLSGYTLSLFPSGDAVFGLLFQLLQFAGHQKSPKKRRRISRWLLVFFFCPSHFISLTRGLGGVPPHMGYIGVCGPKGNGFSALLVINRVLILAILVMNRVWFLYSSLDMGTLLRRSQFFIVIEKKINKCPSQIMFTVI